MNKLTLQLLFLSWNWKGVEGEKLEKSQVKTFLRNKEQLKEYSFTSVFKALKMPFFF